jgi:hypothetical protein
MSNHENCVNWGDKFCHHPHDCFSEKQTNPTQSASDIVEAAVKAAYNDWPTTVTSPALAKLSGQPIGMRLSYERSCEIGADHSGLCRIVTAALSAAEPLIRANERGKVVARFRDAIANGYPTSPNKRDQCAHNKFGWEDCIACYDEALEALADAIEAGSAG